MFKVTDVISPTLSIEESSFALSHEIYRHDVTLLGDF